MNKTRKIIDSLMGMMAVLFALPLLWVIRTAFMPKRVALNLSDWAMPTLENFKNVLAAAPFQKYYLNTIFITVGILLIQFILITLAGYAFARIEFWGDKTLFTIFMAQMMIAPEVLILPNYRLMTQLHLTDTLIGIMLPFFASAMGTLIVRQNIKTIPYQLEEAARVDGASLIMIIGRIYVPLLKPAYIAFGMISVAFQWNNFLWPLIMTESVENRTLSLGLGMFSMTYETGAQWSEVCAATLLVSAPLLLLFIVFQKQFIESFVHSGIK